MNQERFPMSVEKHIGESLSGFQSALLESGNNLDGFIKHQYIDKWIRDEIYHVMAIRTTMVNAMQEFLIQEGLLNLERVSLSPVTDPLAHDIEHTPSIRYKGHQYVTTHSMIYSKFLACFNPKIKGIFVDSPNIRLELPSPIGEPRKKYLIDFSQMDIEVKRDNRLELSDYLENPKKVTDILNSDYEKAIDFFERMIVHAITSIVEKNSLNVNALNVILEVPEKPFPRFRKDNTVAKYGAASYEKKAGEETKSQFFWITGLMRENYDLIYPYLKSDGTKIPIDQFSSTMIYNYDICAQSIHADNRKMGQAYEVASGAIREWLYEPIVERLIDNKIISTRPVFKNGCIENIEEFGGYGPFLMAVAQKNDSGQPLFPATFGGGIGIERILFALLNGPKIRSIDDVTLFGKNPDKNPVYLY